MTTRTRNILTPLAIVLLTILAYLPALNAGFIWDDDQHVTQNDNLRSAEGLWRIWTSPEASPQYYPVAHTIFWIEYQLWGLWPGGDHAVSILLHAANAVLVWIGLKRLRVPGALLAAALFALHPVQVETVAWIMETKTLLSTLFYLLAFLCFIRFWKLDTQNEPSPQQLSPQSSALSPKFYLLALLFFALSLLSKSVTATLPVVLLITLWWKHHKISLRDILLTLPMFAMGALAGYFTAKLEITHVGAEGAEWAFTPIDRILIAGRALWFYLAKLLWPHPLIFFYPRWSISTSALWQFLFPIAAVAAIAILWLQRQRIGRAPLAATLFFIVTLAPALGFLNFFPMRYSFVADHFQYLACLGILTLASALFMQCTLSAPAKRILTAVILAPLFLLTFSRCFAYHDAFTLYQDIVAKNPDSWGGQALLASEYRARGDFAQAAEHFARATALQPHIVENAEGLGTALLGLHQTDEAIDILSKVVERDPSRGQAYNDLAGAYVQKGDLPQAITLYQQAVRRNPSLAEAHFNLGDLYARTGQFAPAAQEFAQALTLRPDWPEAALNTGRCLATLGQLPAALSYFQLAVHLRPGWTEADRDLARLRSLLPAHP